MARKVDNESGFLVIELSPKEAHDIKFGTPQGCICMMCNNIIQENMYYCAVLNEVLCRECYDEWMEEAIYYPDERGYELRNYNRTARKLGMEPEKY